MGETQRLEIAFVSPLTIRHETAKVVYQFISVTLGNFTITVEEDYIMYTLPVGMMVKMQVTYVDAGGNPAQIDGDVRWQSSDESIARVSTDGGDDTVCQVLPTGKLGQVQVTATADADIGEGTRELITIADISIVAGEAVAGTIQPVGDPTPLEVVHHK